MQNRQESLDVASPGQLWFPSLDSASSDSCWMVFRKRRKSAYRLRMAVPNLSMWPQHSMRVPCFDDSRTPALLFNFDESDRLNAAHFFFASITVDSFWETQQTQEKCRGEYLIFGEIIGNSEFQDYRQVQSLRQEQNGLAPGVLWQSLPQWAQKTNWQTVRET